MQIIDLEEEFNTKIGIALFRNVTNLESVKRDVENGVLEACVLRPGLIVSTLQIALAANQAIARKASGSLITKTVYTELIFNLSPSKNISESLKTFSAQTTENTCFVVQFLDPNEKFNVEEVVQGERADITALNSLVDEKLVQKIFAIQDSELEVSSLEDSVLTRLAVKSSQAVSK